MAWWVIPTVIGIGSSIISGNKQAAAGRKQAQAQNDAVDRQYGYDVEAYNMNNARLQAQWAYTNESIRLKERNEAKLADYQDAVAEQRYNYDLTIRDQRQASLDQQFLKSEDIYNRQVSLNSRTAHDARTDELEALQEIEREAAFENQDLLIQTLLNEGKYRARGVSGRSASKIAQTFIATRGRQQAILTETVMSGRRNTRSALKEIARDKYGADLAAEAQRMLEPGELPMPLRPLPTPRADFMYPQPLQPYDFGPEPVAGAYANVSAASDMGWATAMSGIASAATAAIGPVAAKYN